MEFFESTGFGAFYKCIARSVDYSDFIAES
jgi:hypothetical protein